MIFNLSHWCIAAAAASSAAKEDAARQLTEKLTAPKYMLSFYHQLEAGIATAEHRLLLFAVLSIISIIAAFILCWICKTSLRKVLPNLGKSKVKTAGVAQHPLFWCFALTGIYFSSAVFSFGPQTALRLYRLYLFLIVVLFTRGIFKVINVLRDNLRDMAKKTGNVYNELLLNMLVPILKGFVMLIVVLFTLDNVFHMQIGTLLAGAGLLSMAIAFAAQNTIANLFGAVVLILDRPFQIGQRVVIDGKDGFIENIGLRSIRMKGRDGTMWCIPNRTVSDSSISNISLRNYFRHVFMLTLTYDMTPEQLELGKKLLHQILDNHPLFKMELNPPCISFANINSYSLDLEAICYFYTGSFDEFAAARDELNFKILRTFNENHLDFAFPTQSLRVENTVPGA